MWEVYPAIDLREGRVVRLRQGDPARETRYAADPLCVARRWRQAGARWLHIVNLDGAFGATPHERRGQPNLAALERILAADLGLSVQFGGGLRDLAAVRHALDLGVRRAVLGTAAVENPALVEAALTEFGPERIALGIDARDGIVRTRGWQETADITALELGRRWAAQGVRWVIFTDISRDGMGAGLNLAAAVELARATGLFVIASGGVAGAEDVRQARAAGLHGVIIGQALYEGRVMLEEIVGDR